MSVSAPQKALTPAAIRARKGAEPIVCLTAYTAPMARLVDAHADLILVGDSLGMVVHGLPSTVGVTLEMMILHGQAVRRAAPARAPRRRPAVRQLRGGPGAGLPQRRPGHGRDRLRRGQARGRRDHGRDHRLPGRARRPGDGACRAHAAGGERHRRLPRAGPRRATPSACSPTRAAVAEAGAFAVVLEKVAEPLARAHHRGGRRSRPSASAPRPPATARCWCSTTCSGSSPTSARRSCAATPSSAPPPRPRSPPTPPTCAPAASRRPSTPSREG